MPQENSTSPHRPPAAGPARPQVETHYPRPRPEGETWARINAAVARPGSNDSKYASPER